MTRLFPTCPSRQKQRGHSAQDDCDTCLANFDCRLAANALGELSEEQLETALTIFFRHMGPRRGKPVYLQAFIDICFALGYGRFSHECEEEGRDPSLKRELVEYLRLVESWHRMAESMLESMDKYWQQYFADVDYLDEDPDSLHNHIVRLREILSREICGTKERLEELGAGRRGRRPAQALRDFIQDLMQVWREYTGEEPTATRDPYKENYTGPFLDFVEAISRPVGCTLSRRFVSQVVWDTKRAKKHNN